MAKVTITLADTDTDTVKMEVQFEPAIKPSEADLTPAQAKAFDALQALMAGADRDVDDMEFCDEDDDE